MSYIPPLVCDTPPPIDFEDSTEDDFGDGMFSNYDSSSLPTSPIQGSFEKNPDDLPLEIPELPHVPHFSHIENEKSEDDRDLKDSLSNDMYLKDEPAQLLETVIDNDLNEISYSDIADTKSLQSDACSNLQSKNLTKNHTKLHNSDNSSNSNDIMSRSESLPSLVFSAESLNCDFNQLEDYDEFQPNHEDVESNLPSLKFDSISDTKSQSSDLEETNISAECENDEVRDARDTSVCDFKFEVNLTKSVVSAEQNVDEMMDDFVEYELEMHDDSVKDENKFAADFSQFEDFSNSNDQLRSVECLRESKIDTLDLQNTVTSDDLNVEDVDDEFGEFNDFNDFSQPQAYVSSSTSFTMNIEELSAKIKPLLDSLFPKSDSDSEDCSYCGLDLSNDTINILKDFENSKALDHQWSSSVGKSSLVTALGIDSRNILYGGKWNSSMPRFAANLGFSPLEPIKPNGTSGAISNSSVSSEIPAAQFDWNSSGLTNPLDGVQEILHKSSSTENQPSRAELDWNSTKAESANITPTAVLGNIHTPLTKMNTKNFIDAGELSQTSSSYVIPGSGALKETHIFTSSKSPYSLPPSRDVHNDKVESKCSDFDYEKAAAGIIINENVVKKEYRDLEYNPDKPTVSKLNCSDDFSDFQSVPIPTTPQNPCLPYQNILSMDFGILQPAKRNETMNRPNIGNVVEEKTSESFHNYKFVENDKSSSDLRLNDKCSPSSSFGEFVTPVIGVSPSDIMFERNSVPLEDEFSDFQSVEPNPVQINCAKMLPNYQSSHVNHLSPSDPKETCNKITDDDLIIKSRNDASNNFQNWADYQPSKVTPITHLTNILQPSPVKPLQILAPQPVKPQQSLHTNTIWPELEIDPDEIARLEAIFPQAKNQSQRTDLNTPSQNTNVSKQQEDDEWSDFVSVQTPAPQPLPITNIISANIIKHQQDDVEWSDFVSSTTQSSTQRWNVSSGPNFASWNAPPQFDSWQSSTLFQQPQHIVPTMTATTNNDPTMISNQSAKTNPNSFFSHKTPSVSLIPDLSFVAPRTLVNRSRTNYQSK